MEGKLWLGWVWGIYKILFFNGNWRIKWWKEIKWERITHILNICILCCVFIWDIESQEICCGIAVFCCCLAAVGFGSAMGALALALLLDDDEIVVGGLREEDDDEEDCCCCCCCCNAANSRCSMSSNFRHPLIRGWKMYNGIKNSVA